MAAQASLQEGIYWAPKTRPGAHFAVVFLRVSRHVDLPVVTKALGQLWATYQNLKKGSVRDLPGHPVPHGNLTVLLGYGSNLFALTSVRRACPKPLQTFAHFRSPLPTGGGPLQPGSGLRYAKDVRANWATEDLVVQFIADTPLAVNRAIVETWKALYDQAKGREDQLPLLITRFYTGFQRDDARSWIDFHDGLSNMPSHQRADAIIVKDTGDPGDRWTVGGTYLTYLRVSVDLAVWRTVSVEQQQQLVGRDKLTGCPLVSLDGRSRGVPLAGCPMGGTREISDSTVPGNPAFFEPPNVSNPILQRSHVQRANHHIRSPGDRNSLRIFRQGYEFLETTNEAPGFRVGLNFVSFQDTPERLFRMLTQEGWLGRMNFGGDPDHQLPGMDRFLEVRAGAIFLVPPVVPREAFPGAHLFEKKATRPVRPRSGRSRPDG
jgi:Dyp-type peroxidase family